MEKLNKFLPFIFALLFLASCNTNEDYTTEAYTKITNGDDGHFRGVMIGMTMEEVKKAEDKSGLKDDEESFLYYDFPLKGEDSYTVSYDFYEGDLYEIEMNAYLDTKETAKKVFKKLKKNFSKKYGESYVDGAGYTIWSADAENGNEVEIALIEDSEAYGYIQLLISDLDA